MFDTSTEGLLGLLEQMTTISLTHAVCIPMAIGACLEVITDQIRGAQFLLEI